MDITKYHWSLIFKMKTAQEINSQLENLNILLELAEFGKDTVLAGLYRISIHHLRWVLEDA